MAAQEVELEGARRAASHEKLQREGAESELSRTLTAAHKLEADLASAAVDAAALHEMKLTAARTATSDAVVVGGAVQVDLAFTRTDPAWIQRLNLKYDGPLSTATCAPPCW